MVEATAVRVERRDGDRGGPDEGRTIERTAMGAGVLDEEEEGVVEVVVVVVEEEEEERTGREAGGTEEWKMGTATFPLPFWTSATVLRVLKHWPVTEEDGSLMTVDVGTLEASLGVEDEESLR